MTLDFLRRSCAWLALAVVLALASPARAEPVRLHVAWVDTPSQLTPLRAVLAEQHPEKFPHLGQSYRFEPVHFAGSPPQIAALAAGDLEIGALGASSLALAITNAHLDMKIVGDVIQDGLPGHFNAYFTVKKDGPVKRIEDMKGRRAAINALGSPVWIDLHVALARHGLADKDYTVIEAQFPNMFAMIEADKVDVVPVISPKLAAAFDATGNYRKLFVAAQEIGPNQASMWAVRADLIAAHRAALVDYLEDAMRATRWFLDPKNHEAAIAIVETATKQPKATIDYAFTAADVGRSPDLVPNLKAVQDEIDTALDLKLLPAAVTVAPGHVDLSLIADAKRRLDGD
jgi:NitT/TauT family transport system substrate-binding protein